MVAASLRITAISAGVKFCRVEKVEEWRIECQMYALKAIN
jgi:hypothetical protein